MLILLSFSITPVVYAQGSKYVKEGTYIGVYWTESQMFGDFDGTPRYYHDYFYTEILDVPYVDDGSGFGVVLGGRGSKGAFEFGYHRTRHDTSSAYLDVGESEASYNIIDLNFKIDVFARDQLRPYILFGFGFPWLTIEDGSIEEEYDYYLDDYVLSYDDATFFGFALNAGTGITYYFQPQWAVTAGLIYRWNWFTSAEGASLDENLLEKAFCFNIGIAYTF